jgi:hypothetical protein
MKTTRPLCTLIALAGLVSTASVSPAETQTGTLPVVVREGVSLAAQTNAASVPPANSGLRMNSTNAAVVGTNAITAMAGPKALTLAEIREMAGKGVSDETILKALRASGAVYILTTKEVNALQQAKVSEAIIDYLLATPRQLRERERIWPVYYPLHWPSLHYDHHSSLFHDYHPAYSHGSQHGWHR